MAAKYRANNIPPAQHSESHGFFFFRRVRLWGPTFCSLRIPIFSTRTWSLEAEKEEPMNQVSLLLVGYNARPAAIPDQMFRAQQPPFRVPRQAKQCWWYINRRAAPAVSKVPYVTLLCVDFRRFQRCRSLIPHHGNHGSMVPMACRHGTITIPPAPPTFVAERCSTRTCNARIRLGA